MLRVYLDSARWPRELPKLRKLSSSRVTRDKVRSRFTLLVTARVGGTTGQAPTLLVVLAAVVVHDSPKKGHDNGRPNRKLIKCLMGSVDDLSGYMPIRTTSMWDYGVGPPRCGL